MLTRHQRVLQTSSPTGLSCQVDGCAFYVVIGDIVCSRHVRRPIVHSNVFDADMWSHLAFVSGHYAFYDARWVRETNVALNCAIGHAGCRGAVALLWTQLRRPRHLLQVSDATRLVQAFPAAARHDENFKHLACALIAMAFKPWTASLDVFGGTALCYAGNFGEKPCVEQPTKRLFRQADAALWPLAEHGGMR